MNILNKQSRRQKRGGPLALGLGEGLTNPNRKKQLVTKCFTGMINYWLLKKDSAPWDFLIS